MSARYVPEWAKVGVEVVESHGGFGERYGRVATITAILGNGNARIDGSKSQWRIGNDYLTEAGSKYSYGRSTFRHLTQEQRARVQQVGKIAEAKKIVRTEAERLEKLWRSSDEDEVLAAAARIKATP